MAESVSEEQLDELINGTGYDYLHQKLAGEVRAARAREAEAYSAGFEQCRRRAVTAEAEVERLQERIDKALELLDVTESDPMRLACGRNFDGSLSPAHIATDAVRTALTEPPGGVQDHVTGV